MLIFHIARVADWEAARAAGAYTVSTRTASLDEEGFIHASTREQVGATAARFYRDETAALVVLVLDDQQIEAAGTAVRHEPAADGQSYPHIFGPIDPAWVREARPAGLDESGAFVF